MEQWAAFLPALGAFLVVIGGGGSFIWRKIEARMDKQEEEEKAARLELKGYLEAQIEALKMELQSKQDSFDELFRHVLVLESIMVREGLEVPERPARA